ncbi:MAG: hypothetical protein ACTSVF_03630 [Candidatus Asgardarchaeia archaeon]
MRFAKGFVMTLEPTLSILLLLIVIVSISALSTDSIGPMHKVEEEMHETDIMLVEDSLRYHNPTLTEEQIQQKMEWIRKNLN